MLTSATYVEFTLRKNALITCLIITLWRGASRFSNGGGGVDEITPFTMLISATYVEFTLWKNALITCLTIAKGGGGLHGFQIGQMEIPNFY